MELKQSTLSINKIDYSHEYPFLTDDIKESITNEFVARYGIKAGDIEVQYSLSNGQGDGVSISDMTIEASDLLKIDSDIDLTSDEWRDEGEEPADIVEMRISQSGHYQHEYTMDMNLVDEDGYEYSLTRGDKVYEAIASICKEAEGVGYSYMEAEDAEETYHRVWRDFLGVNNIRSDYSIDDVQDYRAKERPTLEYTLVWNGEDSILDPLYVKLTDMEERGETLKHIVFSSENDHIENTNKILKNFKEQQEN